MFTIIGGDGKEYGPVTTEQVRAWLSGGRANLDTKAKAVGSSEWQRLGDFPEFNGSPRADAPPPQIMVAVSDPKAFAADLLARGTPLDVFGCLGQGFELWKSHFLALVGVTLLVLIAQMVAGMIPILGMLSGLLLNGVFYGGLYYYYLGKLRGEPRTAGDAFAGFTKSFVPLMLATLFTSLILVGVLLVFSMPLFLFVVKIAMQGAAHLDAMPAFSPLALVGFFIGMLVLIYLSISWMFTFLLVIDQGMAPWTAMEVSRRVVSKQWFRVFFVGFLGGLLAMLGLIALFIGVIFTLPLAFCAIVCAYENLFRPPPRA
jgi:hypothetical protein